MTYRPLRAGRNESAINERSMSPKALQYIMDHVNVTMTQNYYAYASSVKNEMDRLAA